MYIKISYKKKIYQRPQLIFFRQMMIFFSMNDDCGPTITPDANQYWALIFPWEFCKHYVERGIKYICIFNYLYFIILEKIKLSHYNLLLGGLFRMLSHVWFVGGIILLGSGSFLGVTSGTQHWATWSNSYRCIF